MCAMMRTDRTPAVKRRGLVAMNTLEERHLWEESVRERKDWREKQQQRLIAYHGPRHKPNNEGGYRRAK